MPGGSQSNLKLSLMPRKSFKNPKHRLLILEAISQTGASLFSHVILHTGGNSLLLKLTYSYFENSYFSGNFQFVDLSPVTQVEFFNM